MDVECLNDESGTLRIVADRSEETLIVRLVGELDMSCTHLLDRVGDLELDGISRIEVEFTDLEFIDSTGIMALLQFWRLHTGAGRAVGFVRLQPFVRRIFLVLGLERYLVGAGPA